MIPPDAIVLKVFNAYERADFFLQNRHQGEPDRGAHLFAGQRLKIKLVDWGRLIALISQVRVSFILGWRRPRISPTALLRKNQYTTFRSGITILV